MFGIHRSKTFLMVWGETCALHPGTHQFFLIVFGRLRKTFLAMIKTVVTTKTTENENDRCVVCS